MDVLSAHDIKTLAESLKCQIRENSDLGEFDGGTINLPAELRTDLLDAMDFLLENARDAESPADGEATRPDLLADRVLQAIDDGLSSWKASFTTGFSEAATQQLGQKIKNVEQLVGDLEGERSRLLAQQGELERQLAETLRQQANLFRQRKGVAKDLKARKAQMLLELERERSEVREQIRNELEAEGNSALQGQIHLLERELAEQRKLNSELDDRLEAAQRELELLKAENHSLAENAGVQSSDLENRLAEAQQLIDGLEEELKLARESQADAAEPSERLTELNDQLALKQLELEELQGAAESLERANQDLAELKVKCAELEENLAANNASEAERGLEIDRLQAQLDLANVQLADRLESAASFASQDEIQALELSLAEARQEITDLREQNSDLAAQVAKQQVIKTGSSPHVQFDQESLSWEERKKLIMQQLEDDTVDGQLDQAEVTRNRLEIEHVVKATDSEIERRDREIAELRSIVEQQSDTKQGVAIGAAAIAQMFDSDELLQQERLKLKQIQQEWEEKLRQAEIDLSMERAKLGRERSQLEAELERAKFAWPPAKQEEAEKGNGKTRKWLEHLGLRDESGGK